MDWYLTTPEGQEYIVDCVDWSLARYYEAGNPRPSEGKLSLPRTCPVIEKQWVRAEEDGQTKFLGYVSRKPSLSGALKTVELRGVEALLWKRPCPNITYSGGTSISGTSFNHLFSSDPPWVPTDTPEMYQMPGGLASANSLIPPGWIATEFLNPIPAGLEQGVAHGPRWFPTYSSYMMKFRYCGKKSRLGTSDIYYDYYKFTEYSTYEELLASGTFGIYRDDLDLYMYVAQDSIPGFGYIYGNLFAHNAFDTKVRRGVLDNPTTLLTVPLKVDAEQMWGDILCQVATAHKQKIRFRYENDGFCYLDVLDDFEDDGIFDIYESDCEKLEWPATSDIQPDAIFGLGNGSRLFRSAYSVFDTRPGKAWMAQVETFQNVMEDYSGNLAPLVTTKWDELREKKPIEIVSRYHDYLQPGQNVRLHCDGEPDTIYQVSEIERSATSPTKISINGRTKDLTDAVKAQNDIGNAYELGDLVEIGSVSFSGVIGVGDWGYACVPFVTEEIYLPEYANYAAYNPAVLVDVSISPRGGHFIPVDVSSQFQLLIGTDLDNLASIGNSETIQYMLDENVTINAMSNVVWGLANYIKVKCTLNGFWPAEARTAAQVKSGINTPSTARDRNDYYKGVWGRILNSEHYAFLVKLDNEHFAYQIQAPGNVDINAAWAVGTVEEVAKAIYFSYTTVSGRSMTQVLADITAPSPAKNRDDYYKGVWGRTSGSGYYVLLVKLESGDKYAYQIQPPGAWIPTNPWSVGTKAQAAAALYASSQEGPRSAADIETDITNAGFADPSTYSYTAKGYDTGSDPTATIIQVTNDPQTLAYKITNGASVSEWKVDTAEGETIAEALLTDFTAEGLRKQSDIEIDIRNLIFSDPATYSWKAYGYTLGATPWATMVQVSNVPQIFAYQLQPDNDEDPEDWAISTDAGEALSALLMPNVKNYDCNVRVYVVRRRSLP